MSRSSFFRPASHDQNPLLPQYLDSEPASSSSDPKAISISMRDLSPVSPEPLFQSTYHDESERAASPSPPPSFYRAQNDDTEHSSANLRTTASLSPSPSRTKARRIQFSAPPPPIASTVLLPPRSPSNSSSQGTKSGNGRESVHGTTSGILASRRARVGAPVDPLLALERREKAIQDELQELLDAQSAGLIMGFGGGGGETHEGGSDAGSSTPTTRSLARSGNTGKGGGIVPVRQPKRKVVGLRGARRALLRDMRALVQVKNEEMEILSEEIEKRQVVLARTDGYEKRIKENRHQLSGYSGAGGDDSGEGEGGGEEAMEIAELRTEERAVENEIREMEDRLAQMKARHRWLGDRIREGINRREARLSSYRGALREVETEAKEFLKRPPISVSIVMGNEEGFYALPANRRTLGMAKEWWNKEITLLAAREDEVDKEKSALEEGAQTWEESIKVVMAFEDDLRTQMSSNDANNVDMLRTQIEKMGNVIQRLSDTLQTAEGRGWNLLICAIGAELEAFKQGEAILQGALAASRAENGDSHDEQDDGPSSSLTNGLDEMAAQPLRIESLEREEGEDDGPNLAELMVDKTVDDDTS
ncbi:uncharacterized protein LY89DRAFT_503937 [Mollisia scopiformis]|uniref:Autophagy-related protein 28 n=1 Tax=Mollisia scopiformis TaxID=149040 RepID=A0A194XG39_MOLSC|nr:uncharacterized protein LY89DRAFT_503937 [Mollisia scopiformis]KUJ18737.1 hypothetical protein LY89DRAFT_503937 [Mollisia scopiformis]